MWAIIWAGIRPGLPAIASPARHRKASAEADGRSGEFPILRNSGIRKPELGSGRAKHETNPNAPNSNDQNDRAQRSLPIMYLRCGPVGVRFMRLRRIYRTRNDGRHKCRPYKGLKRKFLSNQVTTPTLPSALKGEGLGGAKNGISYSINFKKSNSCPLIDYFP